MKLNINQALQQGATAIKEGKFKIAEKLYQAVLKAEPKNIDAHNNLGITFFKLNKLKEAESSYRKAIELNPNFVEAHYNLAFILQIFSKLEEAESSYRKAIELKQDYAEAHNNLGLILLKLNKIKEAELSYKKAIQLKPKFTSAYFNMGFLLHTQNRLDEAEVSYNKAIELQPNDKITLLNRGQVLFEKGDLEPSLKDFDFCNTEDSRLRALTCLHALGRTKEIYNRIKKNSELDDINIRVAAFSSFIIAKEKKDTGHKFCKNPIEFIHISNLSSHQKSTNLFIDEIIEELQNIKTSWEPLGKTTVKGFQSKSDLFKNPKEKMRSLKSIIINELELYYLRFKNENCSYIKKWPSENNLACWQVILKQQGYQSAHIHPGGWLSGVVYLKVTPELKKNEGAIEFCLDGEHYSDINSPKVIHQPKLGDIVLFPSSLHHRTIPFSTNTDRISIAFDLMPNIKND